MLEISNHRSIFVLAIILLSQPHFYGEFALIILTASLRIKKNPEARYVC
ncbi:hypothetical protein SAMN05216243_0845 [Sediminibacillus albus]|uniref:Uncharacterized protein n=1 Tax=Sediminibacillus albus TaxID=407036 RepID=A0A1G8WK43_9BACI|nr:hypothetical protein SAMN05216243_0845 [Sediminibacillus albus]